jgi:hypothetical protein
LNEIRGEETTGYAEREEGALVRHYGVNRARPVWEMIHFYRR